MQAEATVNLPERVTLSMEKVTEGSILNNVRNSMLAPPTNLPWDGGLLGEDCIVGDPMCSRP